MLSHIDKSPVNYGTRSARILNFVSVSGAHVIATPVSPSNRVVARIGIAGWSFSSADSALFGEGESVLSRYATRFNAVEINSSFHRSHQHKTYVRWADSVPNDFRFSVKIPKTITHQAKLRATGKLQDQFLAEVSGLGDRLGGLLIQLPPSLALDPRIVSTFFSVVLRRTSVSLACEPRHASWFTSQAEDILMRHKVTRVAADPAKIAGSDRVAGSGPWRYWRWHGSPRMYYSGYTAQALHELVKAVRCETPEGVEPWIIFDNTAHGHASSNAFQLQTRLVKARASKGEG